MDNARSRLPITSSDLLRLIVEQQEDAPEIELARSFLEATLGEAVADIEPGLLREVGNKLQDPDTLISGPNILKWQNLTRPIGPLWPCVD